MTILQSSIAGEYSEDEQLEVVEQFRLPGHAAQCQRMLLAQHRSRSGWSDRQVSHARQCRWVLFAQHRLLSSVCFVDP
jgi:hypothetical protein